MRVIPVIDVMGGQVVRAVGGRRNEYRPIESRLTDSTDPVEVGRVLCDYTGSDFIYVADLDSILTPSVDTGLTARLCDAVPEIRFLVDIGVRVETDLLKLNPFRPSKPLPIIKWPTWERINNLVPIIATETVETLDAWAAVSDEFSPSVAFSVDIREDRWLGRWEPWAEWGLTETAEVEEMIDVGLYALGGCFLILLDLGCVGGCRGYNPRFESWLEFARKKGYTGEIARQTFVGGGIRDWDDVKRLEDAGADGVLVASALHNGTLTFPRPA